MKVTAFENANGTLAIPVINEAHYEREIRVSMNGSLKVFAKATAYLADNTHNNTLVGSVSVEGKSFTASVKPRSLTTFFLE